MHRILAFLVVMLFCVSAAAQDKFAEDRRLIEQVARERGLVAEPVKAKPRVEHKRQWANFDRYRYHPGRSALLDFGIGHHQNYYDGILTERYKRDEVRTLLRADSSRVVPKGIEDSVVVYPPDWPAKVKKREKYKDGVIAKGEPDKDGKYVVIYDISDLIYEPPNFVSPYGSPAENLRRAYRDYQRQNRPYYDLFDDQNTLPELPEDRGPHYSAEKAERIAGLIRKFLRDDNVEVIVPKVKDKK